MLVAMHLVKFNSTRVFGKHLALAIARLVPVIELVNLVCGLASN